MAHRVRNHRVDELLRSNDPPSDRDRQMLSDLVKQYSTRLESLGDGTQMAPGTSGFSTPERDQAALDLHDCKTILHPIRLLSTEILCSIFELCRTAVILWPADFAEVTCSLDTDLPPWTLVQVCSRWRAVGLACSQLWAHIHLDFQWIGAIHSDLNQRNIVAFLLGLQLDRSRTRPLTVAINRFQEHDEGNQLLINVLSCSSRWEAVTLALPWNSYHDLSSVRGFLPSLRNLSIEPTFDEDEFVGSPCDAFEFAPQLRNLHVANCGSTPNVHEIVLLPWTQIEDYVGWDVHNSCNVEILSRTTALRTCETLVAMTEEVFTATVPPPLAYLRKLDLHSGGIGQLLDTLTLPALTDLSISYYSPSTVESDLSLSFVPDMIKRSGCELETFKLSAKESSDDELLAILRVLNKAHHLSLQVGHVSAAVISQLFYRPGLPFILPSLETLDLRGTTLTEDSYYLAVAVFASRRSTTNVALGSSAQERVSGLKTVRVNSSLLLDERIADSIQNLRDAGLDIDSVDN